MNTNLDTQVNLNISTYVLSAETQVIWYEKDKQRRKYKHLHNYKIYPSINIVENLTIFF